MISQGRGMTECQACLELIPEIHLAQHLEDVHVGPIPLEEVRLRCAQCEFSVGRVRIQAMINHCAKTRHDPTAIELDWRNFAPLERSRTLRIIQLGLEHCNPQEDNRSALENAFPSPRSAYPTNVPPPSPKMTPPNSVPRSKSHKFTDYISETEEDDVLANIWQRKSKSVADLKEEGISPGKLHHSSDLPSARKSFPNGISEAAGNGITHSRPRKSSPKHIPNGHVDDYIETKSLMKALKRKPKEPREPRQKSTEVCKMCTSALNNVPNVLVRHAVLHDRDLQPFVCVICGSRFTRKDRVAEHCSKCTHSVTGRKGTWRLELSENVRDQILTLLDQCFPQVDWIAKCQYRIPGFPLTPADSESIDE